MTAFRTHSSAFSHSVLSYVLVFAASICSILLMNEGDEARRLTWDDAYILLSGSRTLLESGRVALTPDHSPFVGLTAFGYVSLVSAVGFFYSDLESVARWLGVILSAGACVGFHSVLLTMMKRGMVSSNLPGATLASVFFAISGQVAFNAWTGMDTALALFVFVWYLAALIRFEAHMITGFLAALLFLVRPDGLILPLLAGAFFVLRLLPISPSERRDAIRPILAYLFSAAIPILIFVAVMYAYLGSPLPNTVSTRMYFYGEMCQDLSKRLYGSLLTTAIYGSTIQWFIGLAGIGLIPGGISIIAKYDRGAALSTNALRLLILAFIVLSLAPFAYLYPSGVVVYHGRYMVLAFTTVMLLAALGIDRLAGWTAFLSARAPYFLKRAAPWLVLCTLAYYGYRDNRSEWKRLHAFHLESSKFHEALYKQAIWVRENTPPDSKVSITDLGVMLYYSERTIIDAIGLANPEMQAYYRTPAGACIPPAERDLSDLADRFDLDYVIAAEGWDRELMGDFVRKSTLPLQRIDTPPGYPIYKVIR